MARKTRKQKIKAAQRTVTPNKSVVVTPLQVAATPTKPVVLPLSAQDIEEARVTKRGIVKTLILIALLFVLQAAVFTAKAKGMLPF